MEDEDLTSPIQALQNDILVSIADALEESDLRNLRLVDKRFYAAVGQCRIKLRPSVKLTVGQLVELGRLFPNAAGLRLAERLLLENASLRGLPDLFPRLLDLNISCCPWLETSGVAHLGRHSSLQQLVLADSEFQSLPNEVSQLKSLRTLHLSNCDNLEALPEGLGALSLLQYLNLAQCYSLVSLPDSICSLTSLTELDLNSCDSLVSLPAAIENLSALVELDLTFCKRLEGLPGTVGGLTALRKLLLAACERLESLPEGLSCLSSLRLLNLEACCSLAALPEGLSHLAPLLELCLGAGCPAQAPWLPEPTGPAKSFYSGFGMGNEGWE